MEQALSIREVLAKLIELSLQTDSATFARALATMTRTIRAEAKIRVEVRAENGDDE